LRDDSESKKRVKRRLKRQREKENKEKDETNSNNNNVKINNSNNKYSAWNDTVVVSSSAIGNGDNAAGQSTAELDGNAISAASEHIILTDRLELLSVIRCQQKVRGFAFSPTAVVNGCDKALVSLVTNALEVYQIPHSVEHGASAGKTKSTDGAIDEENGNDITPLKLSLIDMHGHRSDVRAVALSGDNQTIGTCSSEGIKLWNAKSSSCIRTCKSGERSYHTK
jgi:U3 small nucleolar RNA-associated protein 12